ncbi:MAG: beta-1,3-glucanase family protein [Streptosporangiaceae bacterium]
MTNHYARIGHAATLDGRGHAFPYDDVTATGERTSPARYPAPAPPS